MSPAISRSNKAAAQTFPPLHLVKASTVISSPDICPFFTAVNNNAVHRRAYFRSLHSSSLSRCRLRRHSRKSLDPQQLPLSSNPRRTSVDLRSPPSARARYRIPNQPLRSQMSHPNHTPPLLLTKRLTAFLHANQTASLPTLLLTTPHGKLLAHASPQPVSVLRTHATVAASLLSIHSSSSPVLPSALPGSRTPDPIGSSPPDEDEDEDADDELLSQSQHQYQNAPKIKPIKPATITVQLSGGTVVIRRLKCGLLFVCVGPAQDGPSEHSSHLHPHDRSGDVSHVGSPGEADSMISTGAQTTASLESSAGTGAAAIALRRHAADLSRWLDDKLGTLTVPEEGVGVQ
ncbi:hypothetical protein BGZ61DRAFT_447921 [Ilyonectria robusta]|uniref:uncharacterized protein n=1 Tax=Ilyonectria robusta TaxID=1079257 RepID=UPI001E8E19C8|nr:uncharacterized protein BGZ61DRAFT_447921 [Ilyonectria robusta]KAH8722061.1 hypothetical protein BGZ61DRAFT_447921 [Ilyonectria robusta]